MDKLHAPTINIKTQTTIHVSKILDFYLFLHLQLLTSCLNLSCVDLYMCRTSFGYDSRLMMIRVPTRSCCTFLICWTYDSSRSNMKLSLLTLIVSCNFNFNLVELDRRCGKTWYPASEFTRLLSVQKKKLQLDRWTSYMRPQSILKLKLLYTFRKSLIFICFYIYNY
jgi:hypothetical protein